MQFPTPQLRRHRGAAAIEYAAVLALLAAACVGGLAFLGETTNDSFLAVSDAVDGNASAGSLSKTSGGADETKSLSEMVETERAIPGPAKGQYRRLAIAFSCLMNVVLWVLLIVRKRREVRDKQSEREAEREARKSPEETLHCKRRQILRLLDEGFGDLIEDRITVRAIMTQEVTVCRASNSAKLIQAKMLEEGLPNVLVVDRENRLVGLLTRSDIPRGARDSVEAFMTPHPISVRPNARLSECIKTFVQHGVSTLPVAAKDGSICGVVLVLDALLLIEAVQMILQGNREELSKIFFCQRNSTSISDIIASTLVEDETAIEESLAEQETASAT